jgi:hypothetical protein
MRPDPVSRPKMFGALVHCARTRVLKVKKTWVRYTHAPRDLLPTALVVAD